MPAILALLKKYVAYIIIVIAVIVIYETGKAKGIAQLESKQSQAQLALTKDSVKTLHGQLDSILHSTNYAVKRVDTLIRYRTIKVDSSKYFGQIADSLAILAANTDTGKVCRVITDAFNRRTAECDLLKEAVHADSIAISVAHDTLISTQTRLQSALITTAGLSEQLKTIQKPYVCHIIFSISCPSRLVSALLGIIGFEGLRIVGGKP